MILSSTHTIFRYPNPTLCPMIQVAYNNLMNSSEWEAHVQEYAPFEQKLQKIFNVTYNLNFQRTFFIVHCIDQYVRIGRRFERSLLP
jgi:hypothetical protein